MKKKTILYVIGIVLLILIITNPSATAFKEYSGAPSERYFIKKYNFFVCSIYYDGDTYLGVVGNFFKLNSDSPKQTSSNNILTLPYRDRVYQALKDNLPGFNISKDQFYASLKNRDYAMQVYQQLKSVLTGFNKSPEQFLSAINE